MRTHRGTSLKAAQYGSKGFEMRNSGKYTHSLLRQRRETTVLIFKATECILHVFKKLCVVRLDLCLAIFHWILKKKIIQIQFTYGKQFLRCNTYGILGWVEVHWWITGRSQNYPFSFTVEMCKWTKTKPNPLFLFWILPAAGTQCSNLSSASTSGNPVASHIRGVCTQQRGVSAEDFLWKAGAPQQSTRHS